MPQDGANRVASHQATAPVNCLVLHGLGGGPYELKPLLDALENEGMRTLAPVLAGHDGPGPVMPPSHWGDWIRKAEEGFAELASSGGPVAVIGFSTGATLGLHLAATLPVSRLVLLAPFLAIRYTPMLPLHPATYIRLVAWVMPNLPRRPPAVRDPIMRKLAAEADRFRTFNLTAALSALELIDRVKPLVPSITSPTLIIQGTLDTVVEPSCAEWLHRNLGAREKSLVHLPRSDHLVALDVDREIAIRTTIDFLLGRSDSAGRQTTDRPS